MTSEQLTQYGTYLVVVVLGGVGQYLHLLPTGTLDSVFLLVVGHVFGTATPVQATLARMLRNSNVVKTEEVVPEEKSPVIELPTKRG